MEVLKISSKSNPNSVAGAIAGLVSGAGVVILCLVIYLVLNVAGIIGLGKAAELAREEMNYDIDLRIGEEFAEFETLKSIESNSKRILKKLPQEKRARAIMNEFASENVYIAEYDVRK